MTLEEVERNLEEFTKSIVEEKLIQDKKKELIHESIGYLVSAIYYINLAIGYIEAGNYPAAMSALGMASFFLGKAIQLDIKISEDIINEVARMLEETENLLQQEMNNSQNLGPKR